ncbi:unnamed protein product [Acanthoscelides obtectus]|uniref:Uncharacterized protein n=1 Tax=Acanthoscelides obtectus TaxID=200917 RepID=A0A9P0MN51_ACAOB|nr:unnamed protein product [Acanthoscelides obtectus]CAK1675344.1 hypothetical protein AOBTE_LOCUS30150 [Acanthoscelides obtectus]
MVHTNMEIERQRGKYVANCGFVNETDVEEILALIGLLYMTGCRKDNHLTTAEMWSKHGPELPCVKIGFGFSEMYRVRGTNKNNDGVLETVRIMGKVFKGNAEREKSHATTLIRHWHYPPAVCRIVKKVLLHATLAIRRSRTHPLLVGLPDGQDNFAVAKGVLNLPHPPAHILDMTRLYPISHYRMLPELTLSKKQCQLSDNRAAWIIQNRCVVYVKNRNNSMLNCCRRDKDTQVCVSEGGFGIIHYSCERKGNRRDR